MYKDVEIENDGQGLCKLNIKELVSVISVDLSD